MRSANDFRTIYVKGMYAPRLEGFATTAGIVPGNMLLRTDTADGEDGFKNHNSAGTVQQRIFAKEDDIQGNDISDTYTNGDRVLALTPLPGDEVLARLASGQNISKGTALTSNGDGCVRADAGSDTIVGYARHAADAREAIVRVIVEIV